MNFLETIDFDWIGMLNFNGRPFRAKLIPSKIWKDLDLYVNNSRGLINYFKKWRTKIEFKTEPSKAGLYKNYIAVGGEYDPETRQCIIQIYNTNFDSFKFNEQSWYKFKYRVIQTLLHEMIHFMQYDRRNDQWSNYILPHKKVGHIKKDAEREYLSCFDEIQAYAHCVYLDLKFKNPDRSVSDLLSVKTLKSRRSSSTLRYFLKTFNYDYLNNYAIPKLLQHVIKWDRKYQLNTKK